MTAETRKAEPDRAAPRRISWGRALLRVIILVVAFLALVAFSAVLADLTLTPSPASADIAGSNLRPGHSLRQYAEDYTFLAACKQIGGNIVMGMPFGLILPVLMPRRLPMLRVVVLTAVVMALVELAQGSIVQGRAFDVDDVILNTSGALLGYLLLGRKIGRRFHALGVPQPVPAAETAPEPVVAEPAPARTASTRPSVRKRTLTKPKLTPMTSSGEKPRANWSERLVRLGRRS
ncbi:VanZ family protein [Streptomyces sp. SID3212]|uniref:VanZ family protein n=1 Tax=unclassified Streptomyces TaxID=2593676 RepID=UPI0013720754|nr:VanZ family protein [Streptomyces sp. SID3212]MYV55563.1 VanZ family protein [Streptomyces sp. SID3212]